MNNVILKFRNGNSKEIKTKLYDDEKILSFLKVIGEWNSDIVEIELIENVVSAPCNYQNIDRDN